MKRFDYIWSQILLNIGLFSFYNCLLLSTGLLNKVLFSIILFLVLSTLIFTNGIRLEDIGKSKGWSLLIFVPFLQFVMFIYLAIMTGDSDI